MNAVFNMYSLITTILLGLAYKAIGMINIEMKTFIFLVATEVVDI